MKFLNSKEDCQWLRDTHLRGHRVKFRSFVLIGTEDCPTELRLYARVKPNHDHPYLSIVPYPDTQRA